MTTLDITFLGTSATIPTKHRNHPGIYVRYHGRDEHCFLMDCGEATQRQIFRFGLNFMRIDHIFITHFHADHFAGILTLLETMTLEGRSRDLFVYGPEADKWVEDIFELGYGLKKFRLVPRNVPYDREAEVLRTGEFSVFSFPVDHGVPAVGYRFAEVDREKMDKDKLAAAGLPVKGRIIGELKEKGSIGWKGRTYLKQDFVKIVKGKSFSYTGDTRYFKGLSDRLKADIIIAESTYVDDRPERYHMSAHDCVRIFDEARPEMMVLTHFSRRYADAREMERTIAEIAGGRRIVAARDGMRVSYGKILEIKG